MGYEFLGAKYWPISLDAKCIMLGTAQAPIALSKEQEPTSKEESDVYLYHEHYKYFMILCNKHYICSQHFTQQFKLAPNSSVILSHMPCYKHIAWPTGTVAFKAHRMFLLHQCAEHYMYTWFFMTIIKCQLCKLNFLTLIIKCFED